MEVIEEQLEEVSTATQENVLATEAVTSELAATRASLAQSIGEPT